MNKDLEAHFRTFLQTQGLEKKKLLLMVSGGVDSSVLLDVAWRVCGSEYLSVLHIHHNARKEADLDEAFVREKAAFYHVSFFSVRLPKITKNREASWRALRLQIAEEKAKAIHAAAILTAHHATDLVETVLFRLIKGAGLKAFFPFDTTTKPFWNLPKETLIAYAKANQLSWREDASNKDTRFHRNQIRQNILPILRTITPNLEKVFLRECKIFQEVHAYLKQEAERLFAKGKIPQKDFLTLPEALQSMLLLEIAQTTVSEKEITACLHWMQTTSRGGSYRDIGKGHLVLRKGIFFW